MDRPSPRQSASLPVTADLLCPAETLEQIPAASSGRRSATAVLPAPVCEIAIHAEAQEPTATAGTALDTRHVVTLPMSAASASAPRPEQDGEAAEAGAAPDPSAPSKAETKASGGTSHAVTTFSQGPGPGNSNDEQLALSAFSALPDEILAIIAAGAVDTEGGVNGPSAQDAFRVLDALRTTPTPWAPNQTDPLTRAERVLVSQNWDFFASLQAGQLTPEIAKAAITADGLLLKVLPEALRTEELCLAAVQQTGLALQAVPEARRTRELCLMAVRFFGAVLDDVPTGLRDREICLAAVSDFGEALKDVPPELRDLEMCLVAYMSYSTLALEHIPEHLRPEVLRAAQEAASGQ
jgi:hypothetical protein